MRAFRQLNKQRIVHRVCVLAGLFNLGQLVGFLTAKLLQALLVAQVINSLMAVVIILVIMSAQAAYWYWWLVLEFEINFQNQNLRTYGYALPTMTSVSFLISVLFS